MLTRRIKYLRKYTIYRIAQFILFIPLKILYDELDFIITPFDLESIRTLQRFIRNLFTMINFYNNRFNEIQLQHRNNEFASCSLINNLDINVRSIQYQISNIIGMMFRHLKY